MSRPLPFEFAKVPSHWTVAPLGFYFSERRTVVSDSQFAPLSVTKDGVVPQLETAAKTDNNDSRKLVRAGDFVINSRSDRKGSAGLALLDGSVSPISTVLIPRPAICAPYAEYLLRSVPFQEEFYRWGSGIVADLWSTRFSAMRRIPLPVPPVEEQRAITAFLNRETAQIDAMIEAQQELANRLDERRLAVLDSAFQPFRPTMVQLRRAARLVTSGSRGWADFYADEGERFLRIGNLSRGSLELRGEVQCVDLPSGGTEGARTRLRSGDLLFSITAYLGSVGVVDHQWAGAFVSQHVGLCRLDPSMFDPRFVGYYMLSSDGQHQLKEGAYGGAKMQLALEDLRALATPIAHLPDQRAVVAAIEGHLSRIDALINAAIDSIALMQERRAALISAAVTGQIDPRTDKETTPQRLQEFT